MRLTRIHLPASLSIGSEIPLPATACNHLLRVLRLRERASLVVFDGNSSEHHAEICRIVGQQVYVRIGQKIDRLSESPLHITLVQGVSRGERMDWTLQKATELGITKIVPVLTTRSVVKLDVKQALKKQEHWQAIVISACEQSGRSVVPVVQLPIHLHDYLNSEARSTDRLILNPTATTSLTGLPHISNKIELLIGPEGGLDDAELKLAEAAGFKSVSLGPRVLRTETAAVVALSVLQASWGDLK
jgi:16S rRNA (uracil1498-N3)-methyltransferase